MNLTEAGTVLNSIARSSVKEVSAIDLDLVLVLDNGDKIIISRGAVTAMNSPQLQLAFADGTVALGEVFEQLNQIAVPADAGITVTSKEITRYNKKRGKKGKRGQAEEESEKASEEGPDVLEIVKDDTSGVSTGTAGNVISKSDDVTKSSDSSAFTTSSQTHIDSSVTKGSGISWPVVAGGLGLLGAAGGGGGGGGGGSGGNSSSGASGNSGQASQTGTDGSTSKASLQPVTLSGAAMLGPISNATVTAYDNQGRALGKAVPVVNGRYSLVLDEPGYRGLILLVVRDNTPGVADNFADEATLRITDLGNTVLRATAIVDGSDKITNVTALTELAVLKTGLLAGLTDLSQAPRVTASVVAAANKAVSDLFKVDIVSGDVVSVTTSDPQGEAILNPEFARNSSVAGRNYGIALKSIANLILADPERYPTQAAAIQKLADSLQFPDSLQNSLKWSDNTVQADLFSERVGARARDSSLAEAQRKEATQLYEQLQNLPTGDTVTPGSDPVLQDYVTLGISVWGLKPVR
ncbi:hypothetical protein [Herbaspirillum sp. VT-16-41]|uniref:hypothetical protein n=1 Tax=Herbaspirillum sp. VT-16-41 TaxID=1953765 RepID=UPI001115A435|nr:hypothetical protein [Herbaspirillum sp. VT-16-41]